MINNLDVTHVNDDYLEVPPDTNSQTGDADLHHDNPPQRGYPDDMAQPQKCNQDQTQDLLHDFTHRKTE